MKWFFSLFLVLGIILGVTTESHANCCEPTIITPVSFELYGTTGGGTHFSIVAKGGKTVIYEAGAGKIFAPMTFMPYNFYDNGKRIDVMVAVLKVMSDPAPSKTYDLTIIQFTKDKVIKKTTIAGLRDSTTPTVIFMSVGGSSSNETNLMIRLLDNKEKIENDTYFYNIETGKLSPNDDNITPLEWGSYF